jgi:molybdopterin molybdotransferase
MPEMFKVLPPGEALEVLLYALSPEVRAETIPTPEGLGRVLAEDLVAPSPLPSFVRSTMDGYAVRSPDTFGASESLPAYLDVVGEIPMGRPAGLTLGAAQAALIHTGGMLPQGADAVVMLEQTQRLDAAQIEVLRAVAPAENTVGIGDDVKTGDPLLTAGHVLKPQDLGGLMALGITNVRVAARPRVAIVSTGDEVVAPETEPGPGQIRDVNTYTIAGIVLEAGGLPLPQGIVPDDRDRLLATCRSALAGADVLVISAGSSVSTRDLTASVIGDLGSPGVVVHGLALKPGKPTILAVCDGKPVIGLPGNPVSAMMVAGQILRPLLAVLQGAGAATRGASLAGGPLTEGPLAMGPTARPHVTATLARNVASAPGREDFVPVRLVERGGEVWAEPVFGKSSLIYTLVKADGQIRVPLDSNGIHQGDPVDVELF